MLEYLIALPPDVEQPNFDKEEGPLSIPPSSILHPPPFPLHIIIIILILICIYLILVSLVTKIPAGPPPRPKTSAPTAPDAATVNPALQRKVSVIQGPNGQPYILNFYFSDINI